MAQLANLIAQVKANETAQNELAIANKINAQLPQPPELDEHTQLLLVPFVQAAALAFVISQQHPRPAQCTF